jgi:hypothetical protein
MEGFWKRMEELGREFNPYQAAFAQQIVVADTDAEAQRLYEKHVRYFFSRCLHVHPGFADAPGYRTEPTMRAGLGTQMAGQGSALNQAAALSWREMIDKGYIVAGSPDSVCRADGEGRRPRSRSAIWCACCTSATCPMICAVLDRDVRQQGHAAACARSGSGYEDHWSPKPMAAATTAPNRAPSRRSASPPPPDTRRRKPEVK